MVTITLFGRWILIPVGRLRFTLTTTAVITGIAAAATAGIARILIVTAFVVRFLLVFRLLVAIIRLVFLLVTTTAAATLFRFPVLVILAGLFTGILAGFLPELPRTLLSSGIIIIIIDPLLLPYIALL